MHHSSLYWEAVGHLEKLLLADYDNEDLREQAFSKIVAEYTFHLSDEEAMKLKNASKSTYQRFQWKRRNSSSQLS